MIYGYLRVSTDMQDANSQRQGVDSFAQLHGWKIDEYISDEGVSGGKDPDKRNLGPLLTKINKGDIIICSEISRLGRDMYMVMDILHLCMSREAVIYTVKDNFILGDSIQSKVLAFAFGLSAEIERQMIRQRTKEGLALRVKMGVLLGRCPGTKNTVDNTECAKKRDDILMQYNLGVPVRRIAMNLDLDRTSLERFINRELHLGKKWIEKADNDRKAKAMQYKMDSRDFKIVPLDREKTIALINEDLTIPQIAERFPEYTYEQVYDTIFCDDEFHKLYRQHGQLKLVKKSR